MDVDGIEHLILKGANKYLHNKKIKSISIELSECFKEQYELANAILINANFKLKIKKLVSKNKDHEKLSKTFNYIFEKIF